MNKSKEESYTNKKEKVIFMWKRVLVGLIAGLISGFFTAGGGLVLVPAFLYILKMEPKQARATSIFCILPMVIVTSIFYGKNEFIYWQTGIMCAIGGVIRRTSGS